MLASRPNSRQPSTTSPPIKMGAVAPWSTRRSKTEKVKEWENLPLRTSTDIENWFSSKASDAPDSPALSLEDQGPNPIVAAPANNNPLQDVIIGSPMTEVHDTPLPVSLQDKLDVAEVPQIPAPSDFGGMTEMTSEPTSRQVSRAEDLRQRHQNLYF